MLYSFDPCRVYSRVVENVRSENVLTLLRFASNVACNFHSTFGAWLGSFASNGYFSFGKFLSVLINFDKFSIFAGLCSLVRGAFCVGVGLEYFGVFEIATDD